MLGAADLIHQVKLEYNVEYIGTYEVSNSSVQYHSALHFRVLPKNAEDHVAVDHFMGHYDKPTGKHYETGMQIDSQKTSMAITTCPADVSDALVHYKLPSISIQSCCSLFPYHIVLDDNLLIKQSGDMLRHFFPNLRPGQFFNETCFIIYPRMPFTFEALRDFERTCFVVGIHDEQKSFSLKGSLFVL